MQPGTCVHVCTCHVCMYVYVMYCMYRYTGTSTAQFFSFFVFLEILRRNPFSKFWPKITATFQPIFFKEIGLELSKCRRPRSRPKFSNYRIIQAKLRRGVLRS